MNRDTVREEFRHLVAREGVQKVAEEINASRNTIYRLIKNETQHPTRAVQANIERFVAERREQPEEDRP